MNAVIVHFRTGSRTWNAIKDFFRPVGEWFSGELPKKTPSDLVNDAYEAVSIFPDIQISDSRGTA